MCFLHLPTYLPIRYPVDAFFALPLEGLWQKNSLHFVRSLIKKLVSQTIELPRLVEATEVLEENIRCILNEFQWHQPINVYGVIKNRYEYINTCDIYELKVLLECIPSNWWESLAIELVNQRGQMIPIDEVLPCLDK